MANIPVNANDRFVIVTATSDGQVDFDFDFLAFTIDQLSATHIRASDGFETALDQTSDFSASGLNNANGGTISLISTTIVIGDKVVIYGDTPIQRLSDFQQAGDFKAETVNTEEDLQTMMMQEMQRDIGQSLKLPLGEVGAELSIENGEYIRRKEDGTGFEGAVLEVVVSTVDAWFQNRDNTSALQAALLANGSIVSLAGVLHVVDDTVGEASATHDLGIDGLSYLNNAVHFADVDSFFADTLSHYPIGTIAVTKKEGFRFVAASSGDGWVTQSGGVEWTAQPMFGGVGGGVFIPEQFGGGTGKAAAVNVTAIQTLLDNVPLGSTCFIPAGNYPVTSQNAYVFTLTRNVNIQGAGRSTLRGDAVSNTTSMIGISMADNGGNLDVRNWFMDGVRMFFNGGGEHAVEIYGGFPLNTCKITNCALTGNNANGGYSFYDSSGDAWQHSLFELNTCGSPIYMQCGDANIFRKNNVFASENGPALTFDMIPGVRNNTVEDNTLVCRDGALHVIDGDEVRFRNNQIEQFQSFGQNMSSPAASVHLEGATRPVGNCVIENNNFGGGTNVDYSIFLDNAKHTVITRNNFVACDLADVYMGTNSNFNIWEFDNQVRGTASRARTDPYFKAVITDNSAGWNIQTPKSLGGQNSWSSNTAYKRKDGMLVFLSQISGGTTAANTIVYYLPVGFRGFGTTEYIPTCDYQGTAASFKITNTNGQVQLLTAAPSNVGLSIPPVYRTKINTTDY